MELRVGAHDPSECFSGPRVGGSMVEDNGQREKGNFPALLSALDWGQRGKSQRMGEVVKEESSA